MEYKQIQELIKTINKSNISELSIKDGDFEITIKQENQVMSAPIFAPIQQPMQNIATNVATPIAAPSTNADTTLPIQVSEPINDKLHTIKSPMIGTFYRSASPESPAFVNVGDEIKPGKVLCIVEAMKLFNEIESEISGKIVKVLADDASPIEYDQPLFLVEIN